MTLAAGSRLGPYEVLAPIGAGGMGEVYRARDTRLGRTVAIKVMSDRLSSPEARQRFEREAKTVSQLSDPHICALYDVGNQDGVEYLVMEYLEGETLADRLAPGPLPLDQALRHGIEIADALSSAHRRFMVHRDLKPGNVMLTRSGAKLLDFGLAKLAEPTADSAVSSLPTNAPPLTQEGTMIGTVAYMAPEQLEGKGADSRSDIFAFGAVLYEMISGERAFSGAGRASLITAIMSSEPAPVSGKQPIAPPALDRLVSRCLAKQPDDRWQSAVDLASELRWIAESRAGAPAAAPRGAISRERFAWIAAAAAVLLLLVSVETRFPRSSEARSDLRFVVPPPERTSFVQSATDSPFALSADGRLLAFAAVASGKRQLWVRSFDALSPRPLAGTEGAVSPFWSPDGRSLGFFADGKLKKVLLESGAISVLCDALGGSGSWNRDGTILFSEWGIADPTIKKIASGGGSVARATLPDPPGSRRSRSWHFWPTFLPDGQHFLFAKNRPNIDQSAVYVASLDSSEKERLLVQANSHVEYAEPGYLFFVRAGSLLAQRFDAKKLRLIGDPVALADPLVNIRATGAASFAVASSGQALAYQVVRPSQLVWVDRGGRPRGTLGTAGDWVNFRISPDRQRVALELNDPRAGATGLWVADVARGVLTRFTVNPSGDDSPVWSPDGRRIIYSSAHGADPPNLWMKSLGEQPPVRLTTEMMVVQWPTDWSSDGRYVLYTSNRGKQDEVAVLPVDQVGKPVPMLGSGFNQGQAVFSPDGHWIAFVSDDSGQQEVYVQPFSRVGERIRISPSGGGEPRWRKDGKELFYIAADYELMAVPVTLTDAFRSGEPARLFTISSAAAEPSLGVDLSHYDVTSDGQTFLVKALGGNGPAPLVVVANGLPELAR